MPEAGHGGCCHTPMTLARTCLPSISSVSISPYLGLLSRLSTPTASPPVSPSRRSITRHDVTSLICLAPFVPPKFSTHDGPVMADQARHTIESLDSLSVDSPT